MRRKKLLLVSLILLLGLMLSACQSTEEESAAETETENVQTVNMVDTAFEPQELTVSVGTTVRWVNDSDLPHTTTADDGTWDSGNMDAGATFEFTFEEPGEYPYYCEFHGGPGGEGMSGTITVTESGATGGGGQTTSGSNGTNGGNGDNGGLDYDY